MLAPFRLQAQFPFAMSNDTTASLLAQAQAKFTAEGCRPTARFLLGVAVEKEMGLSIDLMGDSMHLCEACDELEAFIKANTLHKLSKPVFEDAMQEAERLCLSYCDEQRQELRIMEEEFRKEMGL